MNLFVWSKKWLNHVFNFGGSLAIPKQDRWKYPEPANSTNNVLKPELAGRNKGWIMRLDVSVYGNKSNLYVEKDSKICMWHWTLSAIDLIFEMGLGAISLCSTYLIWTGFGIDHCLLKIISSSSLCPMLIQDLQNTDERTVPGLKAITETLAIEKYQIR